MKCSNLNCIVGENKDGECTLWVGKSESPKTHCQYFQIARRTKD